MKRFEILCATMHQKDFSKIQEMNIHSDVLFANQADRTEFTELELDGHKARMITTDTRGVGVNRNLTLLYAQGDICLFADDDVTYNDDLEKTVLGEFEAHPDADVMIFYLDTTSDRKDISYPKTQKCRGFYRMPWGAPRIAFRLDSVKRANLWFTTLFGGGCIFPCGEDTLWLSEAREKGLTFYVSEKTIGTVSYEESSWFTGYDEKYYFGQGALYQALRPKSFYLWLCYSVWRTRGEKQISIGEKIKWIRLGRKGYQNTEPYQNFLRKQ